MEWGDVPEAVATMPAPAGPQPADLPPAGEPEPGAVVQTASGTTVSAAEQVLRALVASGKGLPAGLAIFLRAAQVAEITDSAIVLELPPGPGMERLTDEPTTIRAVEDALAEQLGGRRLLTVRPLGRRGGRGEQPARLTPERVKAEKLARMSRDEPMLGRVVQEWDLELLD